MGWWEGLGDALWPEACPACDEVLGLGVPGFCEGCVPEVLEQPAVQCERCGEPGHFAGSACPRCREAPPPFERVRAPYEHEGAVAHAIHRFKYEDRADLARPLGALLARGLQGSAGRVLVPVPLHEARFRRRRFDQAALLAAEVGRVTGLPVAPGWLRRVRPTARQVGLDEAAREHNVRGAFAAAGAAGQRVVLVDDVYTTGATVREAARMLLEAGALAVEVATVARVRRESLR